MLDATTSSPPSPPYRSLPSPVPTPPTPHRLLSPFASFPLTLNDTTMSGNELEGNAISPLQQMMASCSGAIVTSTFVTPFDVVKIRIQAAAAATSSANSSTAWHCPKCMTYFNGLMDHVCYSHAKPMAPAPCYRLPASEGVPGSFRSFLQILRHEGFFVLWSGLPPTLLMAVPNTVIYFTTYDNLKRWWGYQATEPGVLDAGALGIPFAAGSIARLAAVTVISPLELIRTKMQSRQLSYTQVGSAISDAVSAGGFRSLWSGWVPSVLRDVPFSGIYFCGYEVAKIHYLNFLQVDPTDKSDMVRVNFASGATSACLSTLLTQPFDVLKTRAQIRLGEADFVGSPRESTWTKAKELVAAEGPRGLFAGLVPRLMKVVPACAIMISSYEYFKEWFTARNKLKGRNEPP